MAHQPFDPLEITTETLLAFIDGREIDLGNRHKALYAKYRQKYLQLGLLDATLVEERAQQETTGAMPSGPPTGMSGGRSDGVTE